MKTNHPSWWTNDHATSWAKVKDTFKHDWDKIKADLWRTKNPTASEPKFDDVAPALELGHGARQQYGKEWSPDLEKKLQRDWDAVGSGRGWSDVQDYVRKGFDGNGSL